MIFTLSEALNIVDLISKQRGILDKSCNELKKVKRVLVVKLSNHHYAIPEMFMDEEGVYAEHPLRIATVTEEDGLCIGDVFIPGAFYPNLKNYIDVFNEYSTSMGEIIGYINIC